jgi:hypothetical protein
VGTNYYLYTKGTLLDRLADKQEDEIHIGKSSGGWCFGLRVHPELGINSLTDWYRVWRRNKNIIKNEYGADVSIAEMISAITERKWNRRPFQRSANYVNENQFLAQNHAEYGPNGLLRHKIDGHHCIAHGPGTWDLMKGEFS